MKKDFIRDYATAAFRLWAVRGCPTYEEEVERIKRKAFAKAAGIDPAKTHAFAEAEVEKQYAELCDILACSETFRILEQRGKNLICDAVRAVYMVEPRRELRKDEISKRVLRFAIETPASERQVYRWLAQARNLFAVARGLRVSDDDD